MTQCFAQKKKTNDSMSLRKRTYYSLEIGVDINAINK